MIRSDLPASVLEAAAGWRTRHDTGPLSSAEEAEFLRWLERDERHAAAFGEMDRAWSVLDRTREIAPSSVGLAPAGPAALPPAAIRRRLPLAVGLAASLALFLFLRPGASTAPVPAPDATVVATDFKRVDLPDGSVARLNADSSLVVEFRPGERRVRLLRGEAHFTVARNAARPFVVETRGVLARAVGTAFSVAARADSVEVCVTEGRVRVEPGEAAAAFAVPELAVGDKVVVRASGGAGPLAAPPVRLSPAAFAAALQWRDRMLAFDAAPLGVIVAEFNRHNQHQLVVDDAALARRTFGGSFRADDPEGFIALVAAAADIVVERRGGRTHLRAAR